MITDASLLCDLFYGNIIKLVMLTVIIFLLIFVVDYFNIFKRMGNKKLNQEIEDALNFITFEKPVPVIEKSQTQVINRNRNSHILLFGGSDTGKTYFIKEYLKKKQYRKL